MRRRHCHRRHRLEPPHNIVDKQKAFNLMLAFYRVIYEVVLMIQIKWLMEKFNQDLLLCYVVMPRHANAVEHF